MSYFSTIQTLEQSDGSYDELGSGITNAVYEPEAVSVETYADRLMDELFEDVERILETGVQLPVESATPMQPSSLTETLAIARLDASTSPLVSSTMEESPSLSEARQAKGALSGAESGMDAIAEVEPVQSLATSPPGVEPHRPVIGPVLERVLLVVATASLATTAVLWLLFYDRMQPGMAPTALVAGKAGTPTPADAEFLSYMERSLEAIERKVAERQQLENALPPIASRPTTGAETGAGLNSGLVASGPSPVLERVYVPVYQPPQVFGSSAVAPPSIVPPSVNSTADDLPTITVAPFPPAVPSITGSPPASTRPADIPNIAPPSAPHVLVGVLELGDRSAALFEINGTTQRIYVGESIGSSGWTLVSVKNQEAIVRRNGEVRSIYVGQRF